MVELSTTRKEMRTIKMSDREKIIQLIEALPDNKFPYVIGFILGLMAIDGNNSGKEDSNNDVVICKN